MIYALQSVTPPAVEPVTLTEAKAHVRVTGSADDTYINTLITVARECAEKNTGRALCTQTWKQYFSEWPDGDVLELPLPPLASVTHLKYTTEEAAVTTWSTDYYLVDTVKSRVVLAPGVTWPTDVLLPVNPIEIQFVCGYGTAAYVPAAIRHAMLLLIGHWYENREEVVIGNTASAIGSKLPVASEYLLAPYVVHGF